MVAVGRGVYATSPRDSLSPDKYYRGSATPLPPPHDEAVANSLALLLVSPPVPSSTSDLQLTSITLQEVAMVNGATRQGGISARADAGVITLKGDVFQKMSESAAIRVLCNEGGRVAPPSSPHDTTRNHDRSRVLWT